MISGASRPDWARGSAGPAESRLIGLYRSRFEYALHELPAGVLFGHDGASVAECDVLRGDLAQYRALVEEASDRRGAAETAAHRALIDRAAFHLAAYQDYLTRREAFAGYEDYLARRQSQP